VEINGIPLQFQGFSEHIYTMNIALQGATEASFNEPGIMNVLT